MKSTFDYTNVSSQQCQKASPALGYFMKIIDDEHLCKICNVAAPSKEVKGKRDNSNSAIKLWQHSKKFHIKIFKQLKPSSAPNILKIIF